MACRCSHLLPGLQSPLHPSAPRHLHPRPGPLCKGLPGTSSVPKPFPISPGCFWCIHLVNAKLALLWDHFSQLPTGDFLGSCPLCCLSLPTGKRLLTSAAPSCFASTNPHDYWYKLMFFSGGETWNKGKSYYFCTLSVGHALNRPEVNFLHVIFCTAGWCDGWKQHFFVPHLETCSFNYVWVAGLKQKRPGLLSSCSWGGLYFLASSTEKQMEKRNYFHSRGCRIWKHFIFLPQRITCI